MHISLDSALGRQRRLNSVGESVLQIAPNAAAAYSLRSLTGGDPKVVRVRRSSNNAEQDFTSSEVSSGSLTSFVNAQVVAPLDIQALSATGRDGDFLIAKAAYSLRSLGTRQATLAATGDTVARADGKFVVQVRRSSDDALKSFTADEVTDGTLLNFVKTEAVTYTSDFSTDTDGWSAGNGSAAVSGGALELTPNTVSTTHHVTESGLVGAGEKVRVSFDVKIPSGQSLVNGFRFVEVSGTTIKQVNNQAQGDFVSYSEEFTSTSAGILRFFASKDGNITFAGDDSEKILIKNIVITNIDENGFVKTWYDQSVTTQAGDTATGNHAVQATAAEQPKIVNAGSLLADGIEFDGSDDTLTAASVSGFGATISMFEASVRDGGGAAVVSMGSSASTANTNFGIVEGSSVTQASVRNTTSRTVNASVSGSTRLGFSVTTGKTSTKVGTLGGTLVETTDDYGNDFTSGELDTIFLGKLRAGSGSTFNGHIREAIIYDTDQTDNRTAIEANIGEAYSIDLPSGVDPGFDQVDGFVETWYDQSGNSNDAVQATAGSQPKIVNAGTFLSELLFEGSQVFDSITLSDSAQPNSIFTVSNTNVASQTRGIYGTNNNQAGYYRSSNKHAIYSSGTGQAALEGAAYVADRDYLRFDLFNGASSVVGVDGNTTSGTTGDDELDRLDIGDSTLSGVNPLNGGIKELILYTSDQSSNRVALETNINSHYSIF